MNDEHADQAAREAIREAYRQKIATVDAATANRLRLMRRSALSGPRRLHLPWATVAAGAMALVVISFGIYRGPVEQEPVVAAALAPNDPVLAASDEESQAFAWLGDAPVAAETETPDGARL